MKTIKFRLPFGDNEFIISGSEKDRSIIGTIEFNKGYYEPHIMNLYEQIIHEDFVCLDIGANIGVVSIALASIAFKGKIFSFEPSMTNYDFLIKNIEQNKQKNISPQKIGLFNKNCILNFNYVEELAGCSFIPDETKELDPKLLEILKNIDSESISCVTLDGWISDHNIQKLDFIKLDVEGSEIKVLQGACNTLLRFKPDMVVEFNVSPPQSYFGESASDFYKIINEIYPFIYLISDKTGELIKIDCWDDLWQIFIKNQKWEDLYPTFGRKNLIHNIFRTPSRRSEELA